MEYGIVVFVPLDCELDCSVEIVVEGNKQCVQQIFARKEQEAYEKKRRTNTNTNICLVTAVL